MSFKVPDDFRVTKGALKSDASFGNNGAFWVTQKKNIFTVIASDQMGWEHVSVSLPNRCPTWEEMCFIKSVFWDESDCVVQYHPSKEHYVNNHPYCLHLWRPIDQALAIPASYMVGKVRAS